MINKYNTTIGILFFGVLTMHGQDASTPAPSAAGGGGMLSWAFNNIFLVLTALIVILALATLYRVMDMLMDLQRVRFIQEHGVEAAKEANMLLREPLWRRVYRALTKVTPIEREQDIDLGHNYDGIRELDNSLPPWWVWMFYVTILFSGVYLWWYHWSSNGADQIKEYEVAMEEGQKVKDAYLAKMADAINENNVTSLSAAADLDAGKEVFKTYCVACHLETGGGSVGPNLTDDYWIHGGGVKNIFKTIKYGVPEKGMISWKDQLRPSEIQKVSSYILTLYGTKPAGGKEPQGAIWKEGDAASPGAAADPAATPVNNNTTK
ncbi:MAG: c-type cytochrome [Saprospiraceae bacterium]|nr:c-type cytochrome [Saprospiraceae bacterium]